MKVRLVSYKCKEQIFDVENTTKIKELKEKLKNELKVDIEDIKLLYASQNLEDNQTLEYYKIKNDTTIFYFNKNAGKAKSKQQNMESSINNDNNNNNQEPEIAQLPENVIKILNLYSSIVKILTYNEYKNIDINSHIHPTIMDKIIYNLRDKYPYDFKTIGDNKDHFLKKLKEDITSQDIQIYKLNYDKAQSLIENYKQKIEDDLIEIIITNTEEQYFNYWENKGLEKATIILEYVKNKFDVKKTNQELYKILNKIS